MIAGAFRRLSSAVASTMARRGVAGQAGAFVATTLIQLANVPVFLASVGARHFGEWLLVLAVTGYAGLLDLGTVAAASIKSSQLHAERKFDEAARYLRQVWSATVFGTLCVSAGLGLLLAALPTIPVTILGGAGAGTSTLVWALTTYAMALTLSTVVEGAIRASGRAALGISLLTVVRLVEFTTLCASLLLTCDLSIAALVLLISRLIGLFALVHVAGQRAPELRLRLVRVQTRCLRELRRPGWGYLAMQAGNLLTNQGMSVVMGTALGPTALAELAVVRTLTNLIRQVVGVVVNGALPQMTRLLAARSTAAAVRMYKRVLRLTAYIGVIAGAALVAAGPQVLSLWTRDTISVSRLVLAVFAVSLLADLPWISASLIVLAANRQYSLAVPIVLSSAGAVVVAWALQPLMGIVAVPIGLLVIDFALTGRAMREAKSVLMPVRPGSLA